MTAVQDYVGDIILKLLPSEIQDSCLVVSAKSQYKWSCQPKPASKYAFWYGI